MRLFAWQIVECQYRLGQNTFGTIRGVQDVAWRSMDDEQLVGGSGSAQFLSWFYYAILTNEELRLIPTFFINPDSLCHMSAVG